MSNSLWEDVNILPHVKQINTESLINAITLAYASNDYHFKNSSWFVDIKNRFRIFKFKNSIYITKRTESKKADFEINKSKMAYELLQHQNVGTKIIAIPVPNKIVTENGDSFLVSKYLGRDMNDETYTTMSPNISMDECLEIVNLFIRNGISYRGFLPRNVIQKDNTLFLLDWEDSSFGNLPISSTFDHLWKTNFLLNWSYIFGFNELSDGLVKKLDLHESLSEPDLVHYEKTFGEIIGHKSSKRSLRNKIDKVVYGAELPLVTESYDFYLHPNDIGHIVADIFSSEIDVLYDILAYVFRRKDEHLFYWHACLITHVVKQYYHSNSIDSGLGKSQLQYYVLITILMMLDPYFTKDIYIRLLLTNNLEKLMVEILNKSQKQSITYLLLTKNVTDFDSLLKAKFINRLLINLSDIKIKNIDIILNEIAIICLPFGDKRKVI